MPRRKEKEPGSEIPTEVIMPWDVEKFLHVLTENDAENVYRFTGFLPNTLVQDGCFVTSFALLESPYLQAGQLEKVVLFLTPDSQFSAERINPLIESYFREERFYDEDFKWRFRKVERQIGEIPKGMPLRVMRHTIPEQRREVLIWPKQADNVRRIRLLLRHFNNDELSFETLKGLSEGNRPFLVFKSTGGFDIDRRLFQYLEAMKKGKAPVPSCYR